MQPVVTVINLMSTSPRSSTPNSIHYHSHIPDTRSQAYSVSWGIRDSCSAEPAARPREALG